MLLASYTYKNHKIEISRVDGGAIQWRAEFIAGGRLGVAGFDSIGAALKSAQNSIDTALEKREGRKATKAKRA